MSEVSIKSLSELNPPNNWAYFPFDEGGGDGSGTSGTVSNDSRANTLTALPLAGSGSTEWSDRNGWIRLNGTDQAMTQTVATDSGITDVFEIGTGAMMLCFQVRVASSAASRHTLFHIGDYSGSNKYGIWIFREDSDTNSKLAVIVRDSTDTVTSTEYTSSVIADNATLTSATTWNVAITFDHVSGGDNQLVWYDQDASSPDNAINNSAGKSMSGVGSIPLDSGNTTPAFRIGRNGTSTPQWFPGEVRRVLCVNYGASGLPSDIATNVIPSLFRNGCVPTWVIE